MLTMAAAQVLILIEKLSKQFKFIERKKSCMMAVLKSLNKKGKSALGMAPSLTV